MAKCGVSWCLLGLLSVIALLAYNVNAEQGPTVNECRVHVEAALKQYWSQPPSQSPAPQSSIPATNDDDDDANDEADDPPVPEAKAASSEAGDQAEQDEGETDDAVADEPETDEKQPDDDDDGTDDEDDHKQEGDGHGDHDDDDDDDDEKGDDDNDDEDDDGHESGEEGDQSELKSHEEEVTEKSQDDKSDDTDDDDAPTEGAADEDTDDDSPAAENEGTRDDEATTEESAVSDDTAGAGVESELPESEPPTEQSEDQDEDDKEGEEEKAVEEQPEEDSKDGDDTDDDKKDDDADDDDKATEGEAEGDDSEDETGVAEVELGGDIDDDDEDEIPTKVLVIRTRQHIDDILGLDDIGTDIDKDEDWLVTSTLKDLKKTYDLAIKPMESLFKYKDISNRVLGDAEVFGKPTVLFLGPWSSGKSSIINYLLGVERTPSALRTGPEPTDTKFTVVTYGEKHQIVSGTEMAADWPYSTVQKFGQGFLDHFRGIKMPHRLLQKVTLIDTPGIMETKKPQDKGYPFNEAFQWFIDRADAIYIVFDPTKLEIGNELEAVLDQLKGREAQIRFILNKADAIRRRDVMRITGQLFWNLSPMLGSSEAPVIYTVSLITKPFHPGSPAKFLLEQEKALLHDIKVTMDKRVENRISYARRHAVRVRNHAKMVDCYLGTYFRHKSIFSNRKQVAESITENPNQYGIYQGLSALTNVSRYDLPDPEVYRDFFRINPLYDFKPLSATCSYFKGCPLDKLDLAIAYDLPELLGKYKKRTKIEPSEWDDEKGR